GIFPIIEPYISFKYQFLDRVGIRVSVGYMMAKISKGTWKMNKDIKMPDSPELDLSAPLLRFLIYFGI
ncbi:MAG: hypothetical protein ACE5QV_01680, partial [Fidelibacterota bacterium]